MKQLIHALASLMTVLCVGCTPATPSLPAPAGVRVERFSYAGRVVDQQGKPIADASVVATHRDTTAFGYIATVSTDSTGHFAILVDTALSGAKAETLWEETVRLEFSHPDFVSGNVEDLRLFTEEQATHLNIVLRSGHSIRGQVVDDQHHGVSSALIRVVVAEADFSTKNLLTDADGHFEIHGLPGFEATLKVVTTRSDQPLLTGTRVVKTSEVDVGIIALAQIEPPPADRVYPLFGMQLTDVNESLQQAFHLHSPHGVLVLDPGEHSDRLGIGGLQRGDMFWSIGDRDVSNFKEFKAELVEASKEPADARSCRVVYSFSRPGFTGSNTQYLSLTPEMVAELARAE